MNVCVALRKIDPNISPLVDESNGIVGCEYEPCKMALCHNIYFDKTGFLNFHYRVPYYLLPHKITTKEITS
jgi:hypothetical protein